MKIYHPSSETIQSTGGSAMLSNEKAMSPPDSDIKLIPQLQLTIF
jgi:hypothetical protein